MKQRYQFKILALLSTILLAFAGIAVGAQQSPDNLINDTNPQLLEEQGLDLDQSLNPGVAQSPETKPVVLFDELPDYDVLLIPESLNDSIGMYDPFDGTFLGNWFGDDTHFSTPINAIPGPDGNIYVSDQIGDAVFVYDRSGNYLSTYADGTDGLNNVRGIAFRDGELFVSCGSPAYFVARFNGPHSRMADFINNGADPFDIHFLSDGRALIADIYGTGDNISLYSADGTTADTLFAVNFPEQIQSDLLTPGDYLNASFSADQVTDFDDDGTIYQTTTWDSGRGVYRLGNGNFLVTSSAGVVEIEPGTGTIIENQNPGVSGRFIELVTPAGPTEVGSISGTVTDGVNPIEAVHVAASGPGDGSDDTDINGDFSIADLPVGTYSVTFTHNDYNEQTIEGVVVEADTDTPMGTVVMTQDYGSISGVVDEVGTGSLIENVHVTVEGSSVEDYTGSDGSYTLAGVLAGDRVLTFSHLNYVDVTTDPVPVNPDEETPFNISLEPIVGSVEGYVLDAITLDPIENIHVVANTVADATTAEDYTDTEGYFLLDLLFEGDYNVNFSGSGYSDTTIGPVTVVANQTTTMDSVEMTESYGYEYYPGDANMSTGQWPPLVIGGDVTYLVGYFRGINQACLIGGTPFYCSGDANGDCLVIGSDVTRMVSYFRGLTSLSYCPDYEPLWLSPDDFPPEAPSGWPNCLAPPSTSGTDEAGGISR